MITTADFKTGMTISFDNNVYQIIEFQHVKPGKGGAFVRTKLRNLRTLAVIDHTFTAGEKLEKAQIDKVSMQYLYQLGEQYYFMNMETFEQIEVEAAQIKDQIKYLKEGLNVEIMYYGSSEILGVILPEKITYVVAETEPAVKGDTKTSALKDAKIESGLLVKVPLFVEQGDLIVISTQTGEYVSRG